MSSGHFRKAFSIASLKCNIRKPAENFSSKVILTKNGLSLDNKNSAFNAFIFILSTDINDCNPHPWYVTFSPFHTSLILLNLSPTSLCLSLPFLPGQDTSHRPWLRLKGCCEQWKLSLNQASKEHLLIGMGENIKKDRGKKNTPTYHVLCAGGGLKWHWW